MRKVPFAEWFISQDIGSERGSALYGDLEELAATRGRLWFWAMYVRVLISLGWRTGGSAFILAFLFARSYWLNQAMFSWMRWNFHWLPRAEPWFHISIWLLNFANLLMGLVFLLPFVLIRFGIHDRLTRLTCAMFLLSLPLFSLRPWAIVASALVFVLAMGAALAMREWRLPMTVLALTLVVRLAALQISFLELSRSHHLLFLPYQDFGYMRLLLFIQFPAAAVTCLYLHRQMLGPRPTAAKPPSPMKTACSR